MITPPVGRVLFYSKPMDMRKSIGGLSIFVASTLDEDPSCGDVYVFYNKRRTKIKILYWQTNGYCLFYKSLEGGVFILPKGEACEEIILSHRQLGWLLEGLDINKVRGHEERRYSVHY